MFDASCTGISYFALKKVDSVYIGGLPTVPKTYSWINSIILSPSSSCAPLIFSIDVKDKANLDVTNSINGLITAGFTGASTTINTFSVNILATSDTSYALGSPYSVTIVAKVSGNPTLFVSDNLFLTVINSCVD